MNKVINKLVFTGNYRKAAMLFAWGCTSFFSFSAYGMLASVIELGADPAVMEGIILSSMSNLLAVSLMFAIDAESIMLNYNALRVLPFKKEECISRIMFKSILRAGLFFLIETLVLLILLTELSVIKVISLVAVLACSVVLMGIVYCFVVYDSMKFKNKGIRRAVAMYGTIMINFAIGALKGFCYYNIVVSDNIAAVIMPIIILIAAVIGLVVSVKKTAKAIE